MDEIEQSDIDRINAALDYLDNPEIQKVLVSKVVETLRALPKEKRTAALDDLVLRLHKEAEMFSKDNVKKTSDGDEFKKVTSHILAQAIRAELASSKSLAVVWGNQEGPRPIITPVTDGHFVFSYKGHAYQVSVEAL